MSQQRRVKVAQRVRRKSKASVRRTKHDDDAIHILLRVRSENGLTVTAHKQMVASRGRAVLGKMGDAISSHLRDALNRQIQNGVKTYLFLTTREGWNGPYVTDRCLLWGVYHRLDEAKRPLVPSYYAASIPNIETWFEFVSFERLTREEMNRIFVRSSGREIMSVIKSSATVFGVGVKPKSK